jgi:hypothetical protein
MRQLLLLLAASVALCLCSQSALATANYVYHEQTGNFTAAPTCPSGATDTACGRYVENTDRSGAAGFQIYSPESYSLHFKVEFQFFTNSLRVYYTTDGSNPSGSFGTPFGTTQVAVASYSCTYSDQTQSCQIVDIGAAAIPAQPAGTTVKYIIGAWHSGGGPEVFANSGTCSGCFSCTDATTGCASTFTYNVIAAPAVPLIISEYRLDGPGVAGATATQQQNDEFVEIYNNSDAEFTVNAFDGSGGYALAASDGVTRFTIPNNTTIPARGHFLGVNSTGYSLGVSGGYPTSSSTAFATGDVTYTTNIRSNGTGEGGVYDGIALFNTANPANFTLANRLDAAGSVGVTNPLYREGAGHPNLSSFAVQHSLVRDLKTGTPKDTGNNETDFLFVDTNGTPICTSTADFRCQRLGAPGPENLSSPIQRNAVIKASLIDPGCAGITTSGTGQPPANTSNTTCALHRDATSDPSNNSNHGTLSIRRRFTNTTGVPVTRLRFRIIDITTFPEGMSNNGIAWLAARTSSDYTATCVGTGGGCAAPGATVDIRGTTLEEAPLQSNGGAFNSTLSAGTITLANQLASGASINVQFLLGVQQNGAFRFFINVEALPTGIPPAAETRQSPTKGGSLKAGASPRR